MMKCSTRDNQCEGTCDECSRKRHTVKEERQERRVRKFCDPREKREMVQKKLLREAQDVTKKTRDGK